MASELELELGLWKVFDGVDLTYPLRCGRWFFAYHKRGRGSGVEEEWMVMSVSV